MDVDNIMTTTVVTTTADETVRSALRKLEDNEIRHLPVVHEGTLIGMISDRDVRDRRPPLDDQEHDPQTVRSGLAEPISSVMSDFVLSMETGESLRDAIDLMLRYKVGAVPVVRRNTNTLVGIVSYIDLLKAVRDIA